MQPFLLFTFTLVGLPWKRRSQASPKYHWLITNWHGIISHNTVIITSSVMNLKSCTQDHLTTLGKRKVHFHGAKSATWHYPTKQNEPSPQLPIDFLQMNFNFVLPRTLWSLTMSSFMFSTQDFIDISDLFHHATCPAHLISLNFVNILFSGTKINIYHSLLHFQY